MSGTHNQLGTAVTPVILTLNEESNIGPALDGLDWADEIVVVDSGSSDRTEQIARTFRNVRWVVRAFDTHARQWEFAIRSTGIRTPYVLALDADYRTPREFVREMSDQFVPANYAGGVAGFEYHIHGQALLGSVYPAKLVIFRRNDVRVTQPGHTQELSVDGEVYEFKTKLVHDDRKPPERFFRSQLEYSRLEWERLAASGSLRWQDRIRRLGVMPLIAGLGAYLKSGGPLRGSASLQYAYERTVFECLLALRVLHKDRAKDSEREKRQADASEPLGH